jgi:hypothetical protein
MADPKRFPAPSFPLLSRLQKRAAGRAAQASAERLEGLGEGGRENAHPLRESVMGRFQCDVWVQDVINGLLIFTFKTFGQIIYYVLGVPMIYGGGTNLRARPPMFLLLYSV